MTKKLAENLLDTILMGTKEEASLAFEDVISSRISSAMDARKIEIAASLYGDQMVEEELEIIDEDEYNSLSDEEKADYEQLDQDQD